VADTYDYEKDPRPPCEFPVDGEININDFGADGKYKDCKVDWNKENSRINGNELHFNVDYSVDKKDEPVIPKNEMKQEQINPELIIGPIQPVPEQNKTTELVGVPNFNLASSKKEVMQKAADPATTAAIVSSIVAVGANAATAYVMKLPQVQKILKQINEVLHKVSKGKLGKKEAVEEKKEEKKEEGSDCKSIHFQTKVAMTALKGQIAAMEARAQVQPEQPSLNFDEYEVRLKKIEKQLKKLTKEEPATTTTSTRGRKPKSQ
jgi:hypothetical protein